MDTLSLRPPPPLRRMPLLAAAAVLVLIAAAGLAAWWLLASRPGAPATPRATPPSGVVEGERPLVNLPGERQAASPPPLPEPAVPVRPFGAADVVPALEALVGGDAAQRMLQTMDLPRHIVATVDNLARESAPASVWPVAPTEGRFQVMETPDGGLQVDPDNMLRYTPLLLLAERVDMRQFADWYRRALPLLQDAYENLGHPGQRFHTRLMVVLDHLLATPPAPQPLRLRLTEVRGPVPSARPWVRYEYADPALEQASAGRKILWRMGPVNQRRVMKLLAAFRDEIRPVAR